MIPRQMTDYLLILGDLDTKLGSTLKMTRDSYSCFMYSQIKNNRII